MIKFSRWFELSAIKDLTKPHHLHHHLRANFPCHMTAIGIKPSTVNLCFFPTNIRPCVLDPQRRTTGFILHCWERNHPKAHYSCQGQSTRRARSDEEKEVCWGGLTSSAIRATALMGIQISGVKNWAGHLKKRWLPFRRLKCYATKYQGKHVKIIRENFLM